MTTQGEFGPSIEILQLHPELLHLASEIDALATSVATGSLGQDPDTAARQLFSHTDIWGKLEAYGEHTNGVAGVIEALYKFDTATEDEDPWAIRILTSVADEKIRGSLRRLIYDQNPAMHAILERAVSEKARSFSAEQSLMNHIEDMVSSRYGYMSEWKTPRIAKTLPPFLRRLTERDYFAFACLESEHTRIVAESSPQAQVQLARDAERAILGSVLGLNKEQSQEYRLAIESRTLKRDDYGTPFRISEGGGLEPEVWYQAMNGFITNYTKLGLERVKLLRQDWGIVNLDNYDAVKDPKSRNKETYEQLVRMCRISEGDEEYIKYLLENDVTIVFTDRYGDRLHTAANDIAGLETEDDTVLFVEVGNPVGFYLYPIRLKQRFGITASTFFVSNHGTPGSGYFGITGKRKGRGMAFDFGVYDPDKAPGRKKQNNSIDVDETQIVRFLYEYMSPSRKTGERLLGLLGCFQGARTSYQKLSTAEAIAWMADVRHSLAVAGSDRMLFWSEGEDSPRELPEERVALMRTFRRISSAALSITVSELQRGTK